MNNILKFHKPFYVERLVNGKTEWLKVDDYWYHFWTGCFCLIDDKLTWLE